MERHLREGGPIPTACRAARRRWALGRDVTLLTTTSAIGTIRKRSGWVSPLVKSVYLSFTFLFAGATLLRRTKTAVAEAHDQTLAFQEFESSLDDEDSRDLDRWKLEVRAWEADNGLPNPFDTRVSRASVTHPPRTSINFLSAPTQNDVRLELAREEAANAQAAGADSFLPVHGSVSPSVWVTIGLDLEEQQ
jgi:hypothetical protein